jgi:hypothetical protein
VSLIRYQTQHPRWMRNDNVPEIFNAEVKNRGINETSRVDAEKLKKPRLRDSWHPSCTNTLNSLPRTPQRTSKAELYCALANELFVATQRVRIHLPKAGELPKIGTHRMNQPTRTHPYTQESITIALMSKGSTDKRQASG